MANFHLRFIVILPNFDMTKKEYRYINVYQTKKSQISNVNFLLQHAGFEKKTQDIRNSTLIMSQLTTRSHLFCVVII